MLARLKVAPSVGLGPAPPLQLVRGDAGGGKNSQFFATCSEASHRLRGSMATVCKVGGVTGALPLTRRHATPTSEPDQSMARDRREDAIAVTCSRAAPGVGELCGRW